MSINLDQISVAKPCAAKWDEMSGDERVRHCGLCKMNVYNLSELSREEAEQLVQQREGRLCVQFYRRADGTLLTKDCPVGVARIRKRMAVLAGAFAASIFMAAGSVLAKMGVQKDGGAAPAQAVKDWLNPPPPQIMMTKGEMCVPLPPKKTAPPDTPAVQ
jgi:hypothetical protein